MSFLELLAILVVIYFLGNLILWCILDSDIELFLCEKFGKPIGSMRGKVVWITGASSGIGKSTALALAKHGVKLCISARRLTELEKLRDECIAVSKSQLVASDILVLQMDMLEVDRHKNHFDKVISHFGKLDVLLNNAGRSQRAKWHEIELTVDKEVFDLDVFSVINLSRIALRYFLENGIKGHLAVTSSVAGLIPATGSPSYTGAKYAINGYFSCLKAEMHEMDVTIFCPGPIYTEFLQNAFTGTKGEQYGIAAKATDRRMTSDRCGQLLAIALANKTFINFVGCFPVPFICYMIMYYPNAARFIINMIGPDRLNRIRDSQKTAQNT